MLLGILSAYAISQEAPLKKANTQDDKRELLQTVIANSMKDIHGLRNFVFQQKVHTRFKELSFAPFTSSDLVTETVIADGKVFTRRLPAGKAMPVQRPTEAEITSAPAFETASVFGRGVPFERIPEFFDVVSVKQDGGQMILKLKRNAVEGPEPKFEITLTAERERLRVISGHYVLMRPSTDYISESIDCFFALNHGYWLPKEVRVTGVTVRDQVIERTNLITYRSFQVESKILFDSDTQN